MTTTSTHNPLAHLDWDDILETLEDEKCVLFLGSGAYEAPGGGDFEQALCDWLDSANPEHPHIQVHNADGFFLFKKNRYKRKVIRSIRDFYNQPFPETETLFSRLARTPFSMIFSLTPDNILARTFDVMGLDYQPDFYFRNRKASEQFERPTKNKPLIYNLLGNIEEPESLVLTHSDFFDYLQSVFNAKSMNTLLKDELENMDRYIFLGLPYEKWYFQLLLRVLSLHSEKLREIERLAMKEFENPLLHQIYTNEFKIEFLPSSSEAFLSELYKKCKEEGLLKALPPKDPREDKMGNVTTDDIREMVANAQTSEAMLHLKVFLNSRKPRSYPLANELVVLRNRHNLLHQREHRGTIDARDFRVEHNQIVEGVVNLIGKAAQL